MWLKALSQGSFASFSACKLPHLDSTLRSTNTSQAVLHGVPFTGAQVLRYKRLILLHEKMVRTFVPAMLLRKYQVQLSSGKFLNKGTRGEASDSWLSQVMLYNLKDEPWLPERLDTFQSTLNKTLCLSSSLMALRNSCSLLSSTAAKSAQAGEGIKLSMGLSQNPSNGRSRHPPSLAFLSLQSKGSSRYRSPPASPRLVHAQPLGRYRLP